MTEDTQKAFANPGLRAGVQTPDGKDKSVGARKRIPMSLPTRKLEAPEIPGFNLYWFLGKNVPRAQQAGYEFVNHDEVPLNQRGVGTDSSISGNADMGSRVSVVAGTGVDGRPEYLYLMKIKEEWWQEDQEVLRKKNQQIAAAIRGKQVLGDTSGNRQDQALRYVKTSDLRTPKPVK